MKRPCYKLTIFLAKVIMLSCPAHVSEGYAASNNRLPVVNTKPIKLLPASPIFEGRGDGVHTCPVTGEVIRTKNLKAEYFGRTVYFCCEGCLKSAQRNPQRFIKPTMAEQNQAIKAHLAAAPQAADSAEFCNE